PRGREGRGEGGSGGQIGFGFWVWGSGAASAMGCPGIELSLQPSPNPPKPKTQSLACALRRQLAQVAGRELVDGVLERAHGHAPAARFDNEGFAARGAVAAALAPPVPLLDHPALAVTTEALVAAFVTMVVGLVGESEGGEHRWQQGRIDDPERDGLVLV